MNKRITESFTKGKAFIPFITCGDPSLEVTEQLVYAMEEAGADLIELGIPFSASSAARFAPRISARVISSRQSLLSALRRLSLRHPLTQFSFRACRPTVCTETPYSFASCI